MTTSTDQRAYLSVTAAAEVMDMSPETIKCAIRSGRLRAKKTGKNGGGRLRIRRDDLDAWFDQMEEA